MRLNSLIDKLLRMREDEDVGYNPEVTIMQETTIPAMSPIVKDLQIESVVQDVAKTSDRVVIIGNEND